MPQPANSHGVVGPFRWFWLCCWAQYWPLRVGNHRPHPTGRPSLRCPQPQTGPAQRSACPNRSVFKEFSPVHLELSVLSSVTTRVLPWAILSSCQVGLSDPPGSNMGTQMERGLIVTFSWPMEELLACFHHLDNVLNQGNAGCFTKRK